MSFLSNIVGHPPERVAIIDQERAYSYGDIVQQARCLAAMLKKEGVFTHEPVSYLAFKSGSAVISMLGIWLAGAVAVPFDPLLKGTVLKEKIRKLGGRRIVSCSTGFEDYCNRGELGGLSCIVLDDDHEPLPLKVANPDQCAMIQCLGETAGTLKFISLSYRALAARASVIGRVWGLQPGDRIFHWLPFAETFGLSGLLAAMAAGATCQLVDSDQGFWHCLDKTAPDLVMANYSEGLRILDGWQRVTGNTEACHPLKLAMADSSQDLLPEIMNIVPEANECSVRVEFGMAESGVVLSLSPEGQLHAGDFIGHTLPGVNVRLVDHRGKEMTSGSGMLEVRSPQLFLGYYENIPHTRDVFNHGWFTTGQYAQEQQNGSYRLLV